jgi:hypothetical protein
VLAPAVIVDALRSLVTWQTVRFRDDAAADRELEIMGFQLLWCYRSLIKAGGSDGVIALTMALPSLSDEDAVALIAYTMASLTAEADPTLRWALGGAARILKLLDKNTAGQAIAGHRLGEFLRRAAGCRRMSHHWRR